MRPLAEADALVLANRGLAYFVVNILRERSYRVRRFGHDAACASALYGLVRASRAWRPDGRANFCTYAYRCIWWRVIRDADAAALPLSVPETHKRRGARFGIGRYAAHARAAIAPTVSVYDLDPDGPGPVDPSPGPVEQAIDREARSRVSVRINRLLRAVLSPRKAEIIRLRFWREQTLDQIGVIMGLTRERIRQLLVSAIVQLRHYRGTWAIQPGREAC